MKRNEYFPQFFSNDNSFSLSSSSVCSSVVALNISWNDHRQIEQELVTVMTNVDEMMIYWWGYSLDRIWLWRWANRLDKWLPPLRQSDPPAIMNCMFELVNILKIGDWREPRSKSNKHTVYVKHSTHFCDFESIPARARIIIHLVVLVILEIFNFNFVVIDTHRCSVIVCRWPPKKNWN